MSGLLPLSPDPNRERQSPTGGAYLSSLEGATEISQQLMVLYQRYGVEVVIESSIRTPRELHEAGAFLRSVEGFPVQCDSLPPPGKKTKLARP